MQKPDALQQPHRLGDNTSTSGKILAVIIPKILRIPATAGKVEGTQLYHHLELLPFVNTFTNSGATHPPHTPRYTVFCFLTESCHPHQDPILQQLALLWHM